MRLLQYKDLDLRRVKAAFAKVRAAIEADSANGLAGFAPRPAWRPMTKFEARGLKLGHGVWDLLFSRPSAPTQPSR